MKDMGRKHESNDKSAKRLHALIVEDSPLDAEFNVRALERAGFDVSCDVASMPEEVATRLRESRYDVILSDYRLQGWSGLETLKLVHENNLAASKERKAPFRHMPPEDCTYAPLQPKKRHCESCESRPF